MSFFSLSNETRLFRRLSSLWCFSGWETVVNWCQIWTSLFLDVFQFWSRVQILRSSEDPLNLLHHFKYHEWTREVWDVGRGAMLACWPSVGSRRSWHPDPFFLVSLPLWNPRGKVLEVFFLDHFKNLLHWFHLWLISASSFLWKRSDFTSWETFMSFVPRGTQNYCGGLDFSWNQ